MNDVDLFQIASRGSGAGVWALVLIAVVTLIKGWPALRKLQVEADGSLRRDLLDEVRQLRADVTAERNACDEKLSAQNAIIAGLQGQIKGLERQLLQLQMSSGRPIELGELPQSAAAQERMTKRLKDEQ